MNDKMESKNSQAKFVLGGSSDEFCSDHKDSEQGSSLPSTAPDPTAANKYPFPPKKTDNRRRTKTGCLSNFTFSFCIKTNFPESPRN